MPAFVRLSLETVDDEFYFSQFLFHLESDGPQNNLVASCTSKQRRFISEFVAYVLEKYPEKIEKNCATEAAFRVHKVWLSA